MTGPKLNERPGTRAVLTNSGYSATKARVVLNLIRNKPVAEARDILSLCDRITAQPILKLVNSAVSNAVVNNGANGDELQVSACFADEAQTLNRSRSRARGRMTPIHKRSSHITVIVSRLPDEEIERLRKKLEVNRELRRRRVQASRSRAAAEQIEEGTEPIDEENDAVDELTEAIINDAIEDGDVGAIPTDEDNEISAGDILEEGTEETEAKAPAKKATAKKAAEKKPAAKKATTKKAAKALPAKTKDSKGAGSDPAASGETKSTDDVAGTDPVTPEEAGE